MCFHVAVAKSAEEIASRYGKKAGAAFPEKAGAGMCGPVYHISAFDDTECCIITPDEEIHHFAWGLIPNRTKDRKSAADIRKLTYNARSETVFEKPSFREAVRQGRCLFPVTGFFEWRHEKGRVRPYYIYPDRDDVFSLGAVYDRWTDPATGRPVFSFSVITTPANPLMEYIHNTRKRMPLIFLRETEEKWLDPALTRAEIEALMRPFDEKRMKAYEIGSDFLKKTPDDETILKKAATGLTLF